MTNSKVVGRRSSNVDRLHTPYRLPYFLTSAISCQHSAYDSLQGHGHRAPTFCTFLFFLTSSLSNFRAFSLLAFSRFVLLTAFCILLTVFHGVPASAGVTVFDSVVMANEPVKLTALTKGLFFPEGGKLVTFYVNSKKIGTTLSGGDGYAFLKYKSSSRGIKRLKVVSGDDTDEGALLITWKKDRVILIEIESTLFDAMLSFKPSEKGGSALRKLSKQFRIVYVSSLMGMVQSRKWLHANEFPVCPVLKWEGSELIDDLKEKGVSLYAIIASPDLLSEASGIEKRFSFDETEDGIEVKDWDELDRYLKR